MPDINAKTGFTVVELLITLGIAGVLAVVAIPLFNSLVKSRRVTTSAELVYEFLQKARTEAVKRNANVYISFTTGDSWCVGMNTGSSCSCSVASNCNLGAISAVASQQATLSITGYASNTFYYNGDHGMASAAGTITFTRYGGTELVTITASRMGGFSTCSTGIGGYTAC